MKNAKTILYTIIIVIVYTLIVSALTGWISGNVVQGSIDQTAIEYRNKLDQFEKQLAAERDRYSKLEELNSSIQERLDNSIERSKEAETLVGAISTGLSGDVGNLEGVIEAIRNLREEIESASAE